VVLQEHDDEYNFKDEKVMIEFLKEQVDKALAEL
jgi:hypothetical protein